MNSLKSYVNERCQRELVAVKNSGIANVDSILSIEERALIYKYTEDGFESLNQLLRITKGVDSTTFGRLLDKTIQKLKVYEDIVYRGADLTSAEINNYIVAENKSSILVEHSFISASKSKAVAYAFGKSCRFRIFSRSGRDISDFSKYGNHHPQNEKEVLFSPNCGFNVLEVTKQGDYTLITLEEVK